MTESVSSKKIWLTMVTVVLVVAGILVWWEQSRSQAVSSDRLQEQVLSIAAELRVPSEQDTMTAATSPESQAQHIRYQIQQDLLAGQNRNQIVNEMIREYGSDVLAAPQAKGVGTLAWLIPFLALVIGCIILIRYFVLFRQGKRQKSQAAHETDATYDTDVHDTDATRRDSHHPALAGENGFDEGAAKVTKSIASQLRDYL